MSDIKDISREVHKRVVKNFPRRKVIVFHVDDIWSLDLVDMRKFANENKGNEYLLNIIDCFSRYAWSIPIKNKTAETVISALEDVFTTSKRIPKKLWTDKGGEFISVKFKKEILNKYHITLYHTFSESKSAIVERFNRTLKSKMWLYFTEHEDHHYLDILPKLIKTYNHSIHSSLGMSPINASKKKNEKKLLDARSITYPTKRLPPKFKVGDSVRLSKTKGSFEKGYEPSWTYEVFKITKVILSNPYTYHIEDLYNEPIQGSFYEQELQKTNKDNVYIVEKKLKSRIRNGQKEWLIHWLGFPEKYDSWVKEKDIT
jgi:hypothetical protein